MAGPERMSQEITNEEIARRFERLALLMEIRGEDQFRIRSYRNAAQTIADWNAPLSRITAEEGGAGLQKIPGIGKAISAKIIELLTSGTFATWEQLTAETPESVLDLLTIDGIGLKTATELHQRFKISTLDDLAAFVSGGGLELVDGIGEKTAEKIVKAVSGEQ